MWRDTLRGWRAFALIYFALIAVLSGLEVIGDLIGLTDLAAFAALSGISPELEIQRLTALVILSTAITVSAAACAFAVFRQRQWSVRAGTVCGIVLVLYAVYQILSGLFILNLNNGGVIFAGTTYGLFGLLAIWLIRRAQNA